MREKVLFAALVLEAAILVASCGARSGLLEPRDDTGLDGSFGGSPVVDSAIDRDAEIDAPPDVSEDVTLDVPKDVEKDGLPPCDPEALFVYLVTAEFDLYRYDPSKNSFFLVGKLECPTTGSPFSMGVSRTGTAYVVYRPAGLPGSNPPGQLFAVSTADASCAQTPFVPGQLGFNLFGMGFAIDDDLLGETLYLAASGEDGQNSLGLGSVDHLNDFALSFIGPFSENPGNRIELTSADDGQLYGYFIDPQGNGGYIVRIDKNTAEILETTHIDAGGDNSAFAFAYWSGDFYIFTSPLGGPTTITRYRPTDGSVTKVSSLGKTVVGAGVSTCTTK